LVNLATHVLYTDVLTASSVYIFIQFESLYKRHVPSWSKLTNTDPFELRWTRHCSAVVLYSDVLGQLVVSQFWHSWTFWQRATLIHTVMIKQDMICTAGVVANCCHQCYYVICHLLHRNATNHLWQKPFASTQL